MSRTTPDGKPLYACADGSSCGGKGLTTVDGGSCGGCRGLVRCPRCGKGWVDRARYPVCYACHAVIAVPPAKPRNAPPDPPVEALNAVFGRQGRPPDEVNDARGEIRPPSDYARPQRTKEKLPPPPPDTGDFAADYGL